jgi:hypothetical protein
MFFAYILVFGVKLSFWRFGLGFEDVLLMAIGAWIVWLIVSDVSRLARSESRRGGWRRRYHHHKRNDSETVDPSLERNEMP